MIVPVSFEAEAINKSWSNTISAASWWLPKRPCLWFRRIYPLLDGVSDIDPAEVNYYSLGTDWNSLYVKGGCDVHVYPGKKTKGSMSGLVH